MWKYIFLLAIVLMVGGADITKVENKESKENKEITTLQKNLNDSSRETTKQDKETTPQVLNGNKIDETSDEGSELNPINPINHVHKESKEVFNYYFIILVVSSLSVMIVISIRANRFVLINNLIQDYNKNIFFFLDCVKPELKSNMEKTAIRVK